MQKSDRNDSEHINVPGFKNKLIDEKIFLG